VRPTASILLPQSYPLGGPLPSPSTFAIHACGLRNEHSPELRPGQVLLPERFTACAAYSFGAAVPPPAGSGRVSEPDGACARQSLLEPSSAISDCFIPTSFYMIRADRGRGYFPKFGHNPKITFGFLRNVRFFYVFQPVFGRNPFLLRPFFIAPFGKRTLPLPTLLNARSVLAIISSMNERGPSSPFSLGCSTEFRSLSVIVLPSSLFCFQKQHMHAPPRLPDAIYFRTCGRSRTRHLRLAADPLPCALRHRPIHLLRYVSSQIG